MAKNGYRLKSPKLFITPSNEADLWESDWIISFRDDDNKPIGTVSFAGEKANGTVPIRVELIEKYRNKGHGTDVLRMMVEWAFLHKNVYEVTAVCEHENDKAVHALGKAGFVFRDGKGGTEIYSVTKPKTTWMGAYLAIGIFIGLALGIVLNSAWVGLVIGLVVCLSTGAAMDAKAAKDRERIVGKYEKKERQ